MSASSKLSTPPPTAATSSTSNQSTNTLLIAGIATATVAAGAVLIYALTRRPTKPPTLIEENQEQSTASGEASTEKVSAANEVSKETLVKVFNEIAIRIQHIIMRLAQEEQRVQQETVNVTPEQLQAFLIQSFQQSVEAAEQEVYTCYGVKEQALQAATEKYKEDEDVLKAIEQLKAVYNAVMGPGQGAVEVPEHVTMQKTLRLLTKTMDILREKASMITNLLRNKGIDRSKDEAKFQEEFQKRYMKEVEKARKNLYTENGITDDLVVQSAVMKYQNDVTFQTELKRYSEEHNRKMAELGFYPQE